MLQQLWPRDARALVHNIHVIFPAMKSRALSFCLFRKLIQHQGRRPSVFTEKRCFFSLLGFLLSPRAECLKFPINQIEGARITNKAKSARK